MEGLTRLCIPYRLEWGGPLKEKPSTLTLDTLGLSSLKGLVGALADTQIWQEFTEKEKKKLHQHCSVIVREYVEPGKNDLKFKDGDDKTSEKPHQLLSCYQVLPEWCEEFFHNLSLGWWDEKKKVLKQQSVDSFVLPAIDLSSIECFVFDTGIAILVIEVQPTQAKQWAEGPNEDELPLKKAGAWAEVNYRLRDLMARGRRPGLKPALPLKYVPGQTFSSDPQVLYKRGFKVDENSFEKAKTSCRLPGWLNLKDGLLTGTAKEEGSWDILLRKDIPSKPGSEPKDPIFGILKLEVASPPQDLLDKVTNGFAFQMEAVLHHVFLALLKEGGWIAKPLASPHPAGLTYIRVPTRDKEKPEFEPFSQVFFQLRKMYNQHYQGSARMLSPLDNPEIYQPFEGIYYGTCPEGMAIMLMDKGGTEFFNAFKDRIRRGYTLAFLIALHQRTALEYFSARSQALPNLPDSPSPALKAEVEYRRRKAFHFTLHHTFASISSISMYQEVYERLLSAMRVRELHRDLKDELEEMDDLLEREHEKSIEATKRNLEILLAFFFPLTLLLSFWGMNFKGIAGETQAAWHLLSWRAFQSLIPTLLLCGIILGISRWPVLKRWSKRFHSRGK